MPLNPASALVDIPSLMNAATNDYAATNAAIDTKRRTALLQNEDARKEDKHQEWIENKKHRQTAAQSGFDAETIQNKHTVAAGAATLPNAGKAAKEKQDLSMKVNDSANKFEDYKLAGSTEQGWQVAKSRDIERGMTQAQANKKYGKEYGPETQGTMLGKMAYESENQQTLQQRQLQLQGEEAAQTKQDSINRTSRANNAASNATSASNNRRANQVALTQLKSEMQQLDAEMQEAFAKGLKVDPIKAVGSMADDKDVTLTATAAELAVLGVGDNDEERTVLAAQVYRDVTSTVRRDAQVYNDQIDAWYLSSSDPREKPIPPKPVEQVYQETLARRKDLDDQGKASSIMLDADRVKEWENRLAQDKAEMYNAYMSMPTGQRATFIQMLYADDPNKFMGSSPEQQQNDMNVAP